MKPVAIVPVAGSGTRLRPLTDRTPKSLLRVAGGPILGHILDPLPTAGIERVVLVVAPGTHGERIRDYASARRDLEIEYAVQETPLGLGHAVAQARAAAGEAPVVIVLGDTIVRTSFLELVRGGSAIGVREVEDPRRFGVAMIRNGRIESLVEKPSEPRSRWALVGLYYLRNGPALFESLEELIGSGARTRGEIQLTDALSLLLRRGEDLRPFPVAGWYDCGDLESLLEANRALLDGAPSGARAGRLVEVPPVAIDPTADVAEAVLGPFASIGPRAVVRRSIVRDSIVNEGATVEDMLLERAVVGEGDAVRGTLRNWSANSPEERASS